MNRLALMKMSLIYGKNLDEHIYPTQKHKLYMQDDGFEDKD